ETAKILKSNPKWKDIPIVAYTASVIDIERVKGNDLFDGLIVKPARKIDIINELKKFLTHEEVYESSVQNEDITNDKEVLELPVYYNDLVKMLEQELLPAWKEIENKLIISKIESFVDLIEDASKKYPLSYLNHYVSESKKFLKLFDLQNLKKNIEEFPKLVDVIKQMGK
ncbi:MAG: hypothetical protein MI922_17145, partial [Bacteroidales bacterium]|nr:hypothetical protein [Bacteroidales bacterium]